MYISHQYNGHSAANGNPNDPNHTSLTYDKFIIRVIYKLIKY